MIVHCPDCSSKYEIAAAKIPEGGIKVRCPRCKAVFPIRSVGEDDPAPVMAAAPRPAANGPAPTVPVPHGGSRVPGAARPAAPSFEPAPAPAPSPRKPKLVTDPAVASRMARAMVHEIVLPRRAEHQASLREGTVLSRFGTDLTRALVLYEERVSPDLPGRDAYFRDAVNDILGGGTRVL